MKVARALAAASVLTWIRDSAYVAWIPDDGTEIVYGQLDGSSGATYADLDVDDVQIQIQTNRGFELNCTMQMAVDKVLAEQFCLYDWRQMKPVRIGGAS